jgi:hypothetical protein
MTFEEILDQAAAMLERRGRLTYRALQYQFKLDEEGLEALKAELIDGQELAVDKDGKMLVWTGKGSLESSVPSLESQPFPSPDPRRPTLDPRPISYTPPHLAQRIRVEQAALEARGSKSRVWPEALSSSGTGFEDVPESGYRWRLIEPGARRATLSIGTIKRTSVRHLPKQVSNNEDLPGNPMKPP